MFGNLHFSGKTSKYDPPEKIWPSLEKFNFYSEYFETTESTGLSGTAREGIFEVTVIHPLYRVYFGFYLPEILFVEPTEKMSHSLAGLNSVFS